MLFGLFSEWPNPMLRQWKTWFEEGVEQLQYSEALGFDYRLIAEHHFTTYGNSPAPLLQALYIGQRTKRLKIGTAAVILPVWQTTAPGRRGRGARQPYRRQIPLWDRTRLPTLRDGRLWWQRRGIPTALSGNAGGAPEGLDCGGILHLQRRIGADRQPGNHLSQAIATAISAALVDGDKRQRHVGGSPTGHAGVLICHDGHGGRARSVWGAAPCSYRTGQTAHQSTEHIPQREESIDAVRDLDGV
jgi:hypothetical protein